MPEAQAVQLQHRLDGGNHLPATSRPEKLGVLGAGPHSV